MVEVMPVKTMWHGQNKVGLHNRYKNANYRKQNARSRVISV